jgi:hypothetical protein
LTRFFISLFTPFLFVAFLQAPQASAQMRSYTCSDADAFFGSVYAPGWDYISGYGSRSACENACWGFASCEAYYCTTIGYCVALHAGPSASSSGTGGGAGTGSVGPSRSNLPFGAACGFNSECQSGQCWLGFCQ